MKSETDFVERRERPRVGVIAPLENIAYSSLRKHNVIKVPVIQSAGQRSHGIGEGTMSDLRIIVSNDQPIREEKYPRTWLLYKNTHAIELHVTYDSQNRPFVLNKDVA